MPSRAASPQRPTADRSSSTGPRLRPPAPRSRPASPSTSPAVRLKRSSSASRAPARGRRRQRPCPSHRPRAAPRDPVRPGRVGAALLDGPGRCRARRPQACREGGGAHQGRACQAEGRPSERVLRGASDCDGAHRAACHRRGRRPESSGCQPTAHRPRADRNHIVSIFHQKNRNDLNFWVSIELFKRFSKSNPDRELFRRCSKIKKNGPDRAGLPRAPARSVGSFPGKP